MGEMTATGFVVNLLWLLAFLAIVVLALIDERKRPRTRVHRHLPVGGGKVIYTELIDNFCDCNCGGGFAYVGAAEKSGRRARRGRGGYGSMSPTGVYSFNHDGDDGGGFFSGDGGGYFSGDSGGDFSGDDGGGDFSGDGGGGGDFSGDGGDGD